MIPTLLGVVCWRWEPPIGYRSHFGPETVNILRAMIDRHYPHPHRFFCVTDNPAGIDPGVTVIKAWNDFADVPSPHKSGNPACYRRLRAFAPDIGQVFGERFVSLDLDCVVTGDLTPLWHRPEDFVIWGDTNPKTCYNGSMFLLRAGSRPQVWETFDPANSPRLAHAAGQFGSDQAWISHCLGPHEAKWTRTDGVYSFRNEIERGSHRLPGDARIVFFHGRHDPWDDYCRTNFPWVRKYYR